VRKIPDTTAFIGAGTAVKAIWTMLIAGCITNGISFCIKQTVDCVLYRLPDKLVQVTQKLPKSRNEVTAIAFMEASLTKRRLEVKVLQRFMTIKKAGIFYDLGCCFYLVAGAGGGEAGCVSKANAIDTYGSIADIRWR